MVRPKNEKLAAFIDDVKNADLSGEKISVSTEGAVEAMMFIEKTIKGAAAGGSKSKRKPVKLDRKSALNRERGKRHYDKKNSDKKPPE